MSRIGATAAATAIAIALSAAPATAVERGDLLGRWCGDSSNKFVTNLHFESDRFSVTWPDTGRRRLHTIQRYELLGQTIRVLYLNDRAEEVSVEYGGFSGSMMYQVPSQAGPMYIFRRC